MLYRYKPEEGRNVRQTAFWAGLGIAAFAGFALANFLDRIAALRAPLFSGSFEQVPILGMPVTGSNLVGAAVFALATWLWVRYLGRAKTADHLIEVEGEMKKVTWPSFREASNSSMVVITTVLILMGFLALADLVLGGVFNFLLWGRLAS